MLQKKGTQSMSHECFNFSMKLWGQKCLFISFEGFQNCIRIFPVLSLSTWLEYCSSSFSSACSSIYSANINSQQGSWNTMVIKIPTNLSHSTIPKGIQGQVRWGLGQPEFVGRNSAHDRVLELNDLKVPSNHSHSMILWFYDQGKPALNP